MTKAQSPKTRELRLILDNIRSVHNVGSIFRTAEAGGVSKIYCLGTTPVPVDRFGRKRKDLAKVALGAEDLVAWEHLSDARSLIKSLKQEGFQIVALEQTADSVDYTSIKAKGKMAIVLGHEVGGVSLGLLKLCDVIAEIPMNGQKESLNVSVAAGVMIFGLLK